MSVLFGIIATIILGIIAVAVFSIWGIPFVVLLLVILGTYLVLGRQKDGSVGRLEHTKPREPTGIPRKGHGDAQTANERVGQG